MLPAPKEVRDLLGELLGRNVAVRPLDRPGESEVTAVFRHDDGSLAALIGFQLGLAANLGAAVGLVPPGTVASCVAAGELTPLIAENLAEVCNVLSVLLNGEGQRHARLDTVYPPRAEVPGDPRAAMRDVGNRMDLVVEVAGYGSGTLSLVLVV